MATFQFNLLSPSFSYKILFTVIGSLYCLVLSFALISPSVFSVLKKKLSHIIVALYLYTLFVYSCFNNTSEHFMYSSLLKTATNIKI